MKVKPEAKTRRIKLVTLKQKTQGSVFLWLFQMTWSSYEDLSGFEFASTVEEFSFMDMTAKFANFKQQFTFLETVKDNAFLSLQGKKVSSAFKLWINGLKRSERCSSPMTDL